MSVRDHGGRAGTAVEQGELTEVLARAERGRLAVVLLHGGLAIDNEEELPADGSLFGQDAPRRHGHFLKGLADHLQVLG
jgi:hypothetical protein